MGWDSWAQWFHRPRSPASWPISWPNQPIGRRFSRSSPCSSTAASTVGRIHVSVEDARLAEPEKLARVTGPGISTESERDGDDAPITIRCAPSCRSGGARRASRPRRRRSILRSPSSLRSSVLWRRQRPRERLRETRYKAVGQVHGRASYHRRHPIPARPAGRRAPIRRWAASRAGSPTTSARCSSSCASRA
jgi:hypothetical protein